MKPAEPLPKVPAHYDVLLRRDRGLQKPKEAYGDVLSKIVEVGLDIASKLLVEAYKRDAAGETSF